VNGTILRRAIEEKDLAALALIAKTQIPEFQAATKQVQHSHTETTVMARVASTTIAFGHFRDDEMEPSIGC
jgi:hypothetical protein